MNVDAMIKHHQAATEVITHAMRDYASAATGTSWNKACFAFEADAILCALSRAGFRILSALEPSSARELALDVEFATIRAMIYCYEGDSAQAFEAQKALAKIEDAIRALSSPDHIADAGRVEGDGLRDDVAKVYAWLREPDWNEEWDFLGWLNRRPSPNSFALIHEQWERSTLPSAPASEGAE